MTCNNPLAGPFKSGGETDAARPPPSGDLAAPASVPEFPERAASLW